MSLLNNVFILYAGGFHLFSGVTFVSFLSLWKKRRVRERGFVHYWLYFPPCVCEPESSDILYTLKAPPLIDEKDELLSEKYLIVIRVHSQTQKANVLHLPKSALITEQSVFLM